MSKRQVQSTFDMLSALRRGRTGQALVEFGRLYESGEALPKLMGGVAYVYRRLARATEMARQGKGLNQALKDAGVFYKEIDESNRYMRRIGRDEAAVGVIRIVEIFPRYSTAEILKLDPGADIRMMEAEAKTGLIRVKMLSADEQMDI